MHRDVRKLQTIHRLKEVERWGTVGARHESAAEHTWSALVLARYFLPKIEPKLDELKVMTMLLYHDLVEIEAGDKFTLRKPEENKQKEKEAEAFRSLKERLPEDLAAELNEAWPEFERQDTRESRFCLAIDKLDPVIHSIFREGDWKQWPISEDDYLRSKVPYFREFPPMLEMFSGLFSFAKEHGYLS